LVLTTLLATCTPKAGPIIIPPTVQAVPTYEVLIEDNVIYAEGLRHHKRLNSTRARTMPLALDVYQPDNDLDNRPAIMFVHGGGFVGGNKKSHTIVRIADYYTSRGWVFISVSYRISKQNGTMPKEWFDYSSNFENLLLDRYLGVYPAQRDAKAALRWVVANADNYNINTDFITVGGSSAGAVTAVAIGVSNPEDFRDEITLSEDPTLATTNLEQDYRVRTILNFWGSKFAVDMLENLYGYQRFDRNDPPLFIAHGTRDTTIPISEAEELKAIYEANKIPVAYYPLSAGHGAWDARMNGKRIEDLAFDFIVKQQQLKVEYVTP
ncbi:MAG: prolyl oligopeptidase family serine peptidase, partial [Bacteroidota bacterium]